MLLIWNQLNSLSFQFVRFILVKLFISLALNIYTYVFMYEYFIRLWPVWITIPMYVRR